MDANQLDEFSRTLSQSSPRRGVLRTVTGALIAGAFVSLPRLHDAEASGANGNGAGKTRARRQPACPIARGRLVVPMAAAIRVVNVPEAESAAMASVRARKARSLRWRLPVPLC